MVRKLVNITRSQELTSVGDPAPCDLVLVYLCGGCRLRGKEGGGGVKGVYYRTAG